MSNLAPANTAVIMAAGLGTRLRPHTLTTPKPLLLVAGRPILEWTITQLPAEITRVILVVNYLKEQIMAHFGSEWHGREIVYVEQPELNGTGGALAVCAPHLEGRFVVMNGDDLYAAADIAGALERERCILAHITTEPGRFGAFHTDAEGRLASIIESSLVQPGALINVGLYVLDRHFFDYPLAKLEGREEFGLPQTLLAVAKDHPIDIMTATFWMPIGYHEDLARATVALKAHTL